MSVMRLKGLTLECVYIRSYTPEVKVGISVSVVVSVDVGTRVFDCK